MAAVGAAVARLSSEQRVRVAAARGRGSILRSDRRGARGEHGRCQKPYLPGPGRGCSRLGRPDPEDRGDGGPVGGVAVRRGPRAAGRVRGGRGAPAGRFPRGGVWVLPGGDQGVRGVVAPGPGVVGRAKFRSPIGSWPRSCPGSGGSRSRPDMRSRVGPGGDDGDVVGSGAYRRRRDPKTLPGWWRSRVRPKAWAAGRRCAAAPTGSTSDEIDDGAISVRTSLSAGPVASLAESGRHCPPQRDRRLSATTPNCASLRSTSTSTTSTCHPGSGFGPVDAPRPLASGGAGGYGAPPIGSSGGGILSGKVAAGLSRGGRPGA